MNKKIIMMPGSYKAPSMYGYRFFMYPGCENYISKEVISYIASYKDIRKQIDIAERLERRIVYNIFNRIKEV